MSASDINQTMDQVRQMARPALSKFSKMKIEDCSEAYLFQSDHFCGIRIYCGDFYAIWKLESTEVQIFRDGHLLQTLSLDRSAQSRAA